ncbi:MAG: hypothetical protein IJQ79_10370 [Bacteroidales bacterium]|nr:hypothetical protein [Bacteroidales bacterium]
MRINGLIWYKVAQPLTGTETGFDEGGNPVPSSPDWEGPVDACVEVLAEERNREYEYGKYKYATYRVLLEIPDLRELFQPTQIKLSLHGEDLGEHAVMSCIRYTTVGRIELII